MKKIIATIVLAVCVVTFCAVYNHKIKEDDTSFFRIHVVANSNNAYDQYVKYEIKDKLLNLINPIIKNAGNFEHLKNFLINSKDVVVEYINNLLYKNKCNYSSNIFIGKRYFNERQIDGITLKAGNYHSYIVNLGSNNGNNWWGLLYPNLSFIGSADSDANYIVYKSKLQEIFTKST